MDAATGHNHDGTAGGGAEIPLTTGVTGVLPIANGGTNGNTASNARVALGLAIGSDIQAYDAGLTSIAGLTTAADKMIYTTASDTYAATDLSSFARTLLDDTSATNARATLGLAIGSDVQAYSAKTAALAALTWDTYYVPIFLGASTVDKVFVAPYMQTGLSVVDESGWRVYSGTAWADQEFQWNGFLSYPVDKTYTIILKAGFDGAITATTTKCASGTATATFKIDGVTIGGSANSVSNSESTQNHSTTNTFSAGQDITMVVSSSSSILDMAFTITYTRTLEQ